MDLSQGPGVDASHPAFHLPGQELLAGNARDFWVLDPCQVDGTTCTTGDRESRSPRRGREAGEGVEVADL